MEFLTALLSHIIHNLYRQDLNYIAFLHKYPYDIMLMTVLQGYSLDTFIKGN